MIAQSFTTAWMATCTCKYLYRNNYLTTSILLASSSTDLLLSFLSRQQAETTDTSTSRSSRAIFASTKALAGDFQFLECIKSRRERKFVFAIQVI
jgi:hypothetical protein